MAVRFARHVGASAMIVSGVALSLGAGLLMAGWCVYPGLSAWSLFVPLALSAIGNGMSQPSALAAGWNQELSEILAALQADLRQVLRQ